MFSRSMCMTICRIMLFFFLAIVFLHRAVPSPQPLTCLKEGREKSRVLACKLTGKLSHWGVHS